MHWKQFSLSRLFTTSDAENNVLNVSLVSKYADATDSVTFSERLCAKKWSERKGEDSTDIFPAHLPPAAVQHGLMNGKLVKGVFYASKENCLEANVATSNQTVSDKLFCLCRNQSM